jgi:hypothetical protein
MPMKRRRDKRRDAVAPEAWDLMFESGHDFFGDLDALRLPDPLRLHPESDARAAAQAAWNDVTRDAWARHGWAFMQQRETRPNRELPWAAVAFGLPATS